ncbi:hypothetical protein [Cyanothece sp. BG0011]|uniref:hypothetical protein n=1 Tax=Cyanothece sp. BG0011 TaxID=2082950 RepID=UPI000D1F2EB8|nr:hypothetical protein [Cyanothece sp. BG0011]
MSGSISLIAGNKSKIFQETVFCINEKLSCYGLPNYKPYYNFEEISKHQNIILPSRDNLPGIDLYLSKKTILHKLKTIAIELEYNPQWTPEKESLFIGEPIYPDLIGEVFDRKQSHFILHFDFCGYYVPIDFDDISVPDSFLWTIGFSINFCNELKEIADKLKLDLGNYTPDFNILYEKRFDELADDVLYYEKFMLLELYNIALASIDYNLLISFN